MIALAIILAIYGVVVLLSRRVVAHRPMRGDDVETWLRRRRDVYATATDQYVALDALLDRYRECADYGLSLRADDDEWGDP